MSDLNTELQLKDPAIAIKKKLIAQDVHRQLELAHKSTHTKVSNKKILLEEVSFSQVLLF